MNKQPGLLFRYSNIILNNPKMYDIIAQMLADSYFNGDKESYVDLVITFFDIKSKV